MKGGFIMKLKIYDKIIIVVILLLSVVGYVILAFGANSGDSRVAKVYFKDELIDQVDLYSIESDEILSKEYTGSNGLIVVEFRYGEVRVEKETSPNNICSIQGWSSSSLKPIICLPNDFFIEIETNVTENSEIDAISH
jgi:hypothetical protein